MDPCDSMRNVSSSWGTGGPRSTGDGHLVREAPVPGDPLDMAHFPQGSVYTGFYASSFGLNDGTGASSGFPGGASK